MIADSRGLLTDYADWDWSVLEASPGMTGLRINNPSEEGFYQGMRWIRWNPTVQ